MESLGVGSQSKPIEKRNSIGFSAMLDTPLMNLEVGPGNSPHSGLQKRSSFKLGKKSSFSKKSNASNCGANDGSQGDGEKSPAKISSDKSEQKDYISRMLGDFDRKKNYEETVIKIMNEMSVSKIKEPEGCEHFGSKFPNPTHKRRTIFLDLDDTLIYVTIIRILHVNLMSYEIEHKNVSGRQMKVCRRSNFFT